MAFKNIKNDYNRGNSLLSYFVSGKHKQYHSQQFSDTAEPPTGLTATGGVISDYTSPPGAVYRAHVFTSSGTFTVSALSNIPSLPNSVEYLVVAGGGGGGYYDGGGGGAGGLRTNLSGHPLAGSEFPVSTSPGSYTVTIGGGGVGAFDGNYVNPGTPSVFGPIISAGGGGGGSFSNPAPLSQGGSGGSGGGGSRGNGST